MISTFAEPDIPIVWRNADRKKQRDPPAAELTTSELLTRANGPDAARNRWYMTEFHRRLALPTACLVLALVGIPLGLSAKKGGKSSGFVITIILVFTYYSISLIGVSLAKEGKLPVLFGAWLADLGFLVRGVVLLYRVEKRPIDMGALRRFSEQLKERLRPPAPDLGLREAASSAYSRAERRPRLFGLNFPMLLD